MKRIIFIIIIAFLIFSSNNYANAQSTEVLQMELNNTLKRVISLLMIQVQTLQMQLEEMGVNKSVYSSTTITTPSTTPDNINTFTTIQPSNPYIMPPEMTITPDLSNVNYLHLIATQDLDITKLYFYTTYPLHYGTNWFISLFDDNLGLINDFRVEGYPVVAPDGKYGYQISKWNTMHLIGNKQYILQIQPGANVIYAQGKNANGEFANYGADPIK